MDQQQQDRSNSDASILAEVEFEITDEEYRQSLAARSKKDAKWSVTRVLYFLSPPLCVALTLYIFNVDPLIGFSVIVVSSGAWTWLTRHDYEKRLRQQYGRKGSMWGLRQHYMLCAREFRVENSRIRYATDWSMISEVAVKTGAIEFSVDGEVVYRVYRRAFADEREEGRFIEAAMKCRRDAKPGESGGWPPSPQRPDL